MKVEMKLEMILLDDKTSNQEKNERRKEDVLNVLSDNKRMKERK